MTGKINLEKDLLHHHDFFFAKIGNKLQNMGHDVQVVVTFLFQMVDPKKQIFWKAN